MENTIITYCGTDYKLRADHSGVYCLVEQGLPTGIIPPAGPGVYCTVDCIQDDMWDVPTDVYHIPFDATDLTTGVYQIPEWTIVNNERKTVRPPCPTINPAPSLCDFPEEITREINIRGL